MFFLKLDTHEKSALPFVPPHRASSHPCFHIIPRVFPKSSIQLVHQKSQCALSAPIHGMSARHLTPFLNSAPTCVFNLLALVRFLSCQVLPPNHWCPPQMENRGENGDWALLGRSHCLQVLKCTNATEPSTSAVGRPSILGFCFHLFPFFPCI